MIRKVLIVIARYLGRPMSRQMTRNIIVILSLLLSTIVLGPPSLRISESSNQTVMSSSTDEGLKSMAPNYDYHATGFNPQNQITRENVNLLELK